MSIMVVLLLCIGCGGTGPTAPASAYAGTWTGTTSQGASISFTVSADQKVTSIVIGYAFNGCTGTKTFSGLSLDVAVHPASAGVGFAFQSGPQDQPNFTSVTGTFDSTSSAAGLAAFGSYDNCLNGLASWSATKH